MIPSDFTLARYRFTLEAKEPLHLSPFKGSALRGGFGHIFKRLACREPDLCNDSCRRGNDCPYGYIFETAPPESSETLRNFSEVPRPFVIQSPDDQRTLIPAGDRFAFGLTLVGRAIEYLPYFVAVFRELGEVGLGRTHGQYTILTVEAILPGNGAALPIYHTTDERLRTVESATTQEHIAARVAALPADHLAIDFLMPARLKHDDHWVREGPPFALLVKALVQRISSLCYFHCGQRWEIDFREFIDRAAVVRPVACRTQWQDWSRFSGRQHQRIDMGGLVGRITYAGDLREYLPILALGEYVHVGKGTVFGNGEYRIRTD